MSDKIEKIEKLEKLVSGSDPMSQIDNEKASQVEPNKDHFDRLMAEANQKQQAQIAAADAVQGAAKVVPTEGVAKLTPMAAAAPYSRSYPRVPSTQEIIAQAADAVQSMESIKRKLATPGLELPSAEVHTLKNKLSHIQESIQIALGKVGLDYTPPESPKGLMSPLQKFIGYMTHGQAQIEGLSTEISNLSNQKEQLDPAKMLAIQSKMGFINGELEFFASALNKALESFKTIMNVQV